MKRVFLGLMIITAFAVPVLCSTQEVAPNPDRAKILAQRAALKTANKGNMNQTVDQKKQAIAGQRAALKQGTDLQKQIHDQQRAKLVERLNSNKKLTQDQRDKELKKFDDNYSSMIQLQTKQNKANDDFFAKLNSDKTMTPEQKRAAIMDHFKQLQNANMSKTQGQNTNTK
jgi:hypothetical protein